MKKGTDLVYHIALSMVPGIGDTLSRSLIGYCGSAEAVFRQKKSRLQRIPGIGSRLAEAIAAFRDFDRAEDEIRFIEKHEIRALVYTDPAYPERLRHISDAPLVLYYLGTADLNAHRMVGVVGTRKSTAYGREFVAQLIEDLAPGGITVISGLAYGIDIQAHRQSLRHGVPTIGVVGHGLDRIYPEQHRATAKKMLALGGLLTEFRSFTNPDRENFPKRNRIVAGLSDVLVVVETAERGGAMITAEIANSYNRDVMALPGRVHDEYSRGCNTLIRKNKAAIITGANDLRELMNWDLQAQKEARQIPLHRQLSNEDEAIVQFLQQCTKAGIDEIEQALGIESGVLALRLLDLEFSGVVRPLPGKYFELSATG